MAQAIKSFAAIAAQTTAKKSTPSVNASASNSGTTTPNSSRDTVGTATPTSAPSKEASMKVSDMKVKLSAPTPMSVAAAKSADPKSGAASTQSGKETIQSEAGSSAIKDIIHKNFGRTTSNSGTNAQISSPVVLSSPSTSTSAPPPPINAEASSSPASLDKRRYSNTSASRGGNAPKSPSMSGPPMAARQYGDFQPRPQPGGNGVPWNYQGYGGYMPQDGMNAGYYPDQNAQMQQQHYGAYYGGMMPMGQPSPAQQGWYPAAMQGSPAAGLSPPLPGTPGRPQGPSQSGSYISSPQPTTPSHLAARPYSIPFNTSSQSPGTISSGSSSQPSTAASSFVPAVKKSAILIKRPDGNIIDVGAIRSSSSVSNITNTANLTTPSIPETTAPKTPALKAPPKLPVPVRLESEAQKAQRLEEAAKQKRIREEEAAEEKARILRLAAMEEEKKKAQQKQEEEAKAAAVAAAEAKLKIEKEEAEARAKKEALEQEQRLQAEKLKLDQEKAAAAAAAAAKAAASESERANNEKERLAAEKASAETAAKAIVPDKMAQSSSKSGESQQSDGKRPSMLDLSKTGGIPSAQASATIRSAALEAATPISNLDSISYPKDIKSPNPDLNKNAEAGKYKYDREFLMQFMQLCSEAPENLPDLTSIGLENDNIGGGNRRKTSAPNRHAGASGFKGPMMGSGDFGSQRSPATSSQNRFDSPRGGMMPGAFGRSAGGSNMGRQSSNNGHMRDASGRKLSMPGGKGSRGGQGSSRNQSPAPMDMDVAPLTVDENRWQPRVGAAAKKLDENSPEYVERQVKSLLNKLTQEKFNSLSDKILAFANRSVSETDGRSLRQVIKLTFEKATDEAAWSEMYAQLCRKLQENIDEHVQDVSMTSNDKPISAQLLFRKYLLNRCQEDFEAGWTARTVAQEAANLKGEEDKSKMDANEKSTHGADDASKSGEPQLLSDEYYAAQKVKRRGLGLVRFIGELFKQSMITMGVISSCIGRLFVSNFDEDDVESLTKLLQTVGKVFDAEPTKGRAHMDTYFAKIQEMLESPSMTPRMKFMLLDLIDLRKARWIPKSGLGGPKTINQIHEDAQRQQAEEARASAMAQARGPPGRHDGRGGINRRGTSRDFGVPAVVSDGWSTVNNPRAELAKKEDFRPVIRSKTAAGPTPFFNKKSASQTPPMSRSNSTLGASVSTQGGSNMFAALEGSAVTEPTEDSSSKRKPLKLAPRTIGTDAVTSPNPDSLASPNQESNGSDDESVATGVLSNDELETRLENNLKEFLAIRKIADGVASFQELHPSQHKDLIKTMVSKIIEGKASDNELLQRLFAELTFVDKSAIVQGMSSTMSALEDTSIDSPQACKYAATLAFNAGLSKEQVENLSAMIQLAEEEDISIKKKFVDIWVSLQG